MASPAEIWHQPFPAEGHFAQRIKRGSNIHIVDRSYDDGGVRMVAMQCGGEWPLVVLDHVEGGTGHRDCQRCWSVMTGD